MIIGTVGAKTVGGVNNIGRFARFAWQSMIASFRSCLSPCTYPLIWTQMNIIGVKSVPVVMITGAFVGMTLAVQAYDQLRPSLGSGNPPLKLLLESLGPCMQHGRQICHAQTGVSACQPKPFEGRPEYPAGDDSGQVPWLGVHDSC